MVKEAEINEEFSKFLKEFGSRPISIKEDNISLRELIEKIILDRASDKVFNTGEAKKCMYCKTTTLYKKHCINKTNRILCSGCKDKFICFKCLCKWDDRRIDHKKCIDSIDCDLFQEYGKGKVYVGKKNDKDPNDNGFENFEKNKYYHPRRCFNCKGLGVKDRHCNHITCICGAQWCWFCGVPYDDNHWNAPGNCKNLHLKGDYNNNFEDYLNERMKLNDDDLLPWERTENKISKKAIQEFINLGKNKLNKKSKKQIESEENDQLCCDCCLDCLDKIKKCFSAI